MQTDTVKNLKVSAFPKAIGELQHSVQFLKFFSIGLMALLFVAIGTVLFLVTRELPVITLNSGGKNLVHTKLPKAEVQIQEAVKQYLIMRYNWNPSNVYQNLKESEAFISAQSLKAFQSSVALVSKFSIDKVVSQRIYPVTVEVDLNRKVVLIKGDRVTSIQGLLAAGSMKLELTFETGDRTVKNPWGLYVTREREE